MTKTSYAQNFEDVILWRALKHVENGTYVDIGAQDPVVDSVSLAFYEQGWRGVHVEPVAEYAERLRQARPDELVVESAIGPDNETVAFFEISGTGLSTGDEAIARRHEANGNVVKRGTVPSKPLRTILDSFHDREIHWLKIDVEGMEKQVIESWGSSPVRPWIVVVESTEPNSRVPTFTAWEPQLLRLGYEFAYFDGLNRFYVSTAHPELKASFGAGPNYFDDFSLTASSPFVSAVRHQLTQATDDAERLSRRVAEQDDFRQAAIAQEKVLKRRLAVAEQHLADIRRSFSWKVAAPLRSVERAANWLAHETRAWTTFKPGSRPRRLARTIIVAGIRQVLKRPRLATFVKRSAARFPGINSRLRFMTYHQRAMSFIARRTGPEDGTLDLYMEPQSVRLIYRRLMRARSNLDRLGHPSPAAGEAKPRLAYISPLPPDQSGIADYSVELLPELARFYSIDVIVTQNDVSDPWILANCPIRDLNWFERHAHAYDRIVYQFGNSLFHDHMFRLLEKYPGIVVLHDYYLGGLTAHLELYGGVRGFWASALYHAHGYHALRDRFDPDKEIEAVNKYPVNLSVLQNAQGVIVHSGYSRQLATDHYGDRFASDWAVVPFPRHVPEIVERDLARKALGFGEHDFLICAFGILGETKLNQRLLQAWLDTPLAQESSCHLVFVGQDGQNNEYCEQLRKAISASSAKKRIRITGFASASLYKQYLQAADVAVQLRTLSRGETSAAVFDCLVHGVPTIVNANGSMAELPRGSVVMLPDEFSTADLASAIMALRNDPVERQALGNEARRLVTMRHSPEHVADQYREAIETISQLAPPTFDVRALAEYASLVSASPEDVAWLSLARKLALETPSKPVKTRQLLVDVSVLAREDFKTGIQRVVRSQLLALLNDPPPGFRVEPVWLGDAEGQWHYRYARRYVLKLLGLPEDILEDDPVEIVGNEVFYMPDFWTDGVVQATHAGLYEDWRARGVQTTFMVYDILPLTMPNCFPDHFKEMHAKWLTHLADSADRLLCISQAVADETRQWLQTHRPETLEHLEITALHLGADISASAPTTGLPQDYASTLDSLSLRPSFLMVGTIEPRKGYLQTLAAFDCLWSAGVDVNLVIVGGEGWKSVPHEQRRTIPEIVRRLRHHPELGKRLFWLEGISDEYLEKVYAGCVCLIASSEGEGFGLPLIEAARHGIPILARDIPVFREIAGPHASYFDGHVPDDLAQAVQNWIVQYRHGDHPKSEAMNWLTWAENVEHLKAILLRD
ncbi:MAG: Group 1 glycosyl transferase [Microvirga sp.]|nr:Group 1 glycosyl transferase [Microvirga sp.]